MLRLLAALVLSLSAIAAHAAPPLEAYGRLPAVESVEISPAGDRIAYIAVAGDTRELVVKNLRGGPVQKLPAGRTKVRGLTWAGPDHLLVTTSQTAAVHRVRGRHEWLQVVSINLKTGEGAVLLNKTPGTMNAVQSSPVVAVHEGETAAFVPAITLVGEGRYDLYRVDLDTGRGRIHAQGTQHTVEWIVGPDGSAVARIDHDERRGEIRSFVAGKNTWRAILPTQPEQDATSLVGLGREPGSLMLVKRDGDHRRFYELEAGEGASPKPLESAARVADGLVYDPSSGRPLALTYTGEQVDYEFLEPELGKAWARIRPAFKGSQVTLESWTPDFKKLVIKVDGREDAATYYLVDIATNKADVVADAWPGVPPEAIAPVRNLTYKAADGLKIPAYLTLPPGKTAKNLPLIVFPHGGPAARDEPGFDWWAQALASRGYAVLQPQFRGSTGFGRKFTEAGDGEWGRKMQTDLSDGVRHLAGEGVIDPKRVCIMGASYGGYAALAGATLDPGVYRCAVSVNGVSDLPVMLETEASEAGGANRSNIRYWTKAMGASFRGRGKLDEVSPARKADKAYAPILLIHGKDDTVVPHNQSVIMQRALQKAGKPVELITLAGEDHWLSRGQTRLEMLRAGVAFLEKHNPPN